jgi:glucose/arabinose dehydrogenase
MHQKCSNAAVYLTCTFLAALIWLPSTVTAQSPSLVDPNLRVRTIVSGLDQPTSAAFLAPNDVLVLEKATGQVKHVVNGVVVGTVLDLAVNSGSERGLLGIALHPNFPATPHVYLYWTESTTGSCGTAPR